MPGGKYGTLPPVSDSLALLRSLDPAALALALALGAGLLAGLLLGWLIARARAGRPLAAAAARVSEIATRLEERSARVGAVEGERDAARADAAALREQLAGLRAAQAGLTSQAAAERVAAADKLATVQDAERHLREAFASLSAEALRQNSESFLALARTSMGEFQQGAAHALEARQKAIADLVAPIHDSLQQVGSRLAEVEKLRIGQHASLGEQVAALARTQLQLQSETSNLVRALRAPAVRGRWGEMQLRRVVEMAGMLEYCDFDEQRVASHEDGRVRPDLIIRLPGGKQVVIDAKAPLGGYLDALEAGDDAQRELHLRTHSRQVRDHITKLSQKAYWSQFDGTPEFVVLFLPGETFFSAALQFDPGLIEYGVDQKVLPASPTTLIALLRAVAYGWRQEQLAENAQRISALGRELHERVVKFAEHFEAVRKGLDGAVVAYNKAVGSLETRVLVSARRFKELGAGSEADVPAVDAIDRTTRQLSAPDAD